MLEAECWWCDVLWGPPSRSQQCWWTWRLMQCQQHLVHHTAFPGRTGIRGNCSLSWDILQTPQKSCLGLSKAHESRTTTLFAVSVNSILQTYLKNTGHVRKPSMMSQEIEGLFVSFLLKTARGLCQQTDLEKRRSELNSQLCQKFLVWSWEAFSFLSDSASHLTSDIEPLPLSLPCI